MIKKQLMVTGFGRAGTSFVMRFFKEYGFRVPGPWLPHFDAGYEIPSEITNDMREEVLTGKKIARWREFAIKYKCRIIKRPSFAILEGKLLEMWHSMNKDFNVLYLIREPKNVVASRLRHGREFLAERKERLDLFDKDLRGCLLTMGRLGIRYKVHAFPYFLDRYDEVYDSLRYLNLELNKEHGREIWNRVVDKNMVHIKDK